MKLSSANRLASSVTVLAGALAFAAGSVVLIGWALDIALLKSVRPGWVAMKPNTAVAFMLTGAALLLFRDPAPSGQQQRAFLSRIAGLLAGLIGLLSLAEYAFDWNPGFDQWLFPEPAGAIGTSHPGRMAPDTAICFALVAVGLESARRARQTRSAPVGPSLVGALVAAIGLVEILTYLMPMLRTYGWGGLTMMALPTAVLFTVLGAAVIACAEPRRPAAPTGSAQPFARPETDASLRFILIFAGLAAGIVAAGAVYYRSLERQFRADAEQQLAAVAELKVGELTRYRRERLGDAALLQNNPAFTELVRRFLTSPADADAERQLHAWLGNYRSHSDYDLVRLLDARGVVRLAIPPGPAPLSSQLAGSAAEVLRSGRVGFQDFYRSDTDQRIYLAVSVPVFDEADRSRPLGAVVLRIDPNRYLYPFINRWPGSSATAETLLIRREGDEAVYLNELRFQKNAALTLRLPLSATAVPAVRAARGEEGIAEGRDYRGVPVWAAMRTIPDSPWALVARRDEAEVFAPLRARLWQVVIVGFVLIFGTGAGVGVIWRQQSLQFYRARLQAAEALRESDRKYRVLFETSADAHLILADDRWVDCNGAATTLFGCAREQIIGARPEDFSPPQQPDGRPSAEEARKRLALACRGESQAFEWEHTRKDGTPFSADVLLNRIELAGAPQIQMVVRDISERKQAEMIADARNRLIDFTATHSLDELLEETINEAEKLTGSVIGFIHFVEADQVSLTLQNWSTRTKAKFCRADGKGMHYSIDKAGVWVDCVRQRQPVIHNDYASLAHRKGMPEGHAKVIRQLVVPVIEDGLVKAILGVGNKPHDYTAADVAAVSRLAEMAWHVAERKQAEENIRRLNATLEQRVADRTAELAAANKELEAFSYSVSHDLRTPLRSIDGFSRIVLEDYAAKLDADGRDSLKRIRAAAQRMGQLIEDMLALSRVSRAELRRERVDLSALALEVADNLRRHEPGRAVELRVADGLAAECDARLMRIVLENLLGNAWKFTGRCAAPRIEVGCTAKPAPGSPSDQPAAPAFFIRDNGAGFEEAYAAKLFGVFQRLHTADQFAGTGIGLANVQRIIHRHGGRVWAEAKVDQGATFYFTLGAEAGGGPAHRPGGSRPDSRSPHPVAAKVQSLHPSA